MCWFLVVFMKILLFRYNFELVFLMFSKRNCLIFEINVVMCVNRLYLILYNKGSRFKII